MKFNLVESVRSKMIRILESIGYFLNQTPRKLIPRKVITNFDPVERFLNKEKHDRPQEKHQKSQKKEIYAYKGSGHNGKGSINREAAIFNHPRKGVPQGRRH